MAMHCDNMFCCCGFYNGGCGNCYFSNGDNGNGILACLIILLIIAIIYFSTKL